MLIRPFEPDDIAQVASLWQYWFRGGGPAPAAGLEAYVKRMYFERPDSDPDVSSLVADDGRGKVLGFLGITTTPVLIDGTSQTMAGLFPPVLDPDASTTVASHLLRRFLGGPQAITCSDGGHIRYERIWELLGGCIAPLASLRWVKVLRPSRLGAERLLERGPTWNRLGNVLRPLAGGGDWLARRAGTVWLRAGEAAYSGEVLTPAGFIEALEHVHPRSRLRPLYSERYLAWQFAEMAKITEQGSFEATLVRAPDGGIAGWWIGYVNPGGVSRVFALDGFDRHMEGVVQHLFARADAAGVGALMGRLEPRLRRSMARSGTLVYNGGSLKMVHTKTDARLLDDAILGRLAFSRLEGENWYWWGIVSRSIPVT